MLSPAVAGSEHMTLMIPTSHYVAQDTLIELKKENGKVFLIAGFQLNKIFAHTIKPGG